MQYVKARQTSQQIREPTTVYNEDDGAVRESWLDVGESRWRRVSSRLWSKVLVLGGLRCLPILVEIFQSFACLRYCSFIVQSCIESGEETQCIVIWLIQEILVAPVDGGMASYYVMG